MEPAAKRSKTDSIEVKLETGSGSLRRYMKTPDHRESPTDHPDAQPRESWGCNDVREPEIAPETQLTETEQEDDEPATGPASMDMMLAAANDKDGTIAIGFVEKMIGQKINKEIAGQLGQKLRDITDKVSEADKEQRPEPEQGGNSLNKKEEQLLRSLQEATRSGNFPAKGSLGNKFRDAHSKAKLKSLTTSEGKTFRMDWAKKLESEIIEKKTHTKRWSRIDTTAWNYRPFGKMVLDFGGWDDPEAIRGAITGSLQCLTMGDPFVKIHPQTKMVLFAIAEIGWAEVFEQSWDQTMTYYKKDTPIPAIENRETETATKATVDSKLTRADQSTAAQKAKEKEKARVDKEMLDKDKADKCSKEKDDPKKKFSMLVRDGTRVKQKLTSATLRAVEIEQEINRDGKFQWARNNDKGDRLIKTSVEVVRSHLNDWHRDFLVTSEFATIKKKYSVDRIVVELTRFIELEPMIDKLKTTCDGFVQASDLLSM